MKGWVGLGGWLRSETVYLPEGSSPIPVLTGLDVEQLRFIETNALPLHQTANPSMLSTYFSAGLLTDSVHGRQRLPEAGHVSYAQWHAEGADTTPARLHQVRRWAATTFLSRMSAFSACALSFCSSLAPFVLMLILSCTLSHESVGCFAVNYSVIILRHLTAVYWAVVHLFFRFTLINENVCIVNVSGNIFFFQCSDIVGRPTGRASSLNWVLMHWGWRFDWSFARL